MRFFTVLACWLLIHSFAEAQPFIKLVSDDGGYGYGFGSDVAFRGEELWVGVSHWYDGFEHTGSVFIYKPDEHGDWAQSGMITQSDTNKVDLLGEGSLFGSAFEVAGDEAIIAGYSGDVSAFKRVDGQWLVYQTLIQHDPNDAYAWTSVEMSGDHAFIAGKGIIISQNGITYRDDVGGVFVFERTPEAWKQIAKITAPLPEGKNIGEFAASICASEDKLVVGAYRDSEKGMSAGAVYAYRLVNGEWLDNGKLTGADTREYDQFGRTISCTSSELIVNSYSGGQIYQFERENDEWVEQADKIIFPGDPTASRLIGSAAIHGNLLLLTGFDDQYLGVVYLFYKNRGIWTYFDEIRSSEVSAGEEPGLAVGTFGQVYALNDQYLVVGDPARRNAQTGNKAGAVYIFNRDDLAIPTSIQGIEHKASSKLDKIYPNPFSQIATVSTFLEHGSNVRLEIYNVLGQLIYTLAHEELPAGIHAFEWKPNNEPAGVYFIKLETTDEVYIRQIVYNP